MTDSTIGFGGGDDSRREVCVEDLCWDIGSGESPEGFPHAVTWVSVEFGHPSPVLEPCTTRSRGPVGGREFDGEQELAEEALLVFFSEGKSLCVTSLRLGIGREFLLTQAAGAIPLIPLTSLPALRQSPSTTADLISWIVLWLCLSVAAVGSLLGFVVLW